VGLATVVVVVVPVVVVMVVVVVVVVVLLILMLLKLSVMCVGDVAVEDDVAVDLEGEVLLVLLLTEPAKDSEASSSRSTIKMGTRHSAMSVM
jgi:hypothetical protein